MMRYGQIAKLAHSESDESLFLELQKVVKAPPDVVSQAIGSRDKSERTEISRILGHLGVIREARAERQAVTAADEAARAATPRGATPRGATPRAAAPRAAAYTPRSSAVKAAAVAAVAGAASRPPTGSNGRGAATMPGLLATPRLGTPRLGAPQLGTLQLGTPQAAAASAAVAAAACPGTAGSSSTRAAREEKEAQASRQITERVVKKLAEVGIDPEEGTAADVLQLLYARASGSSYWLMNREAETRCKNRAQTPLGLQGVLTDRAHHEVRRARDMPASNLHEYLDKWEIDTLVELCRSVRHFDEVAKGHSSEYKREYPRRAFGADHRRKTHAQTPVL